MTKTRAELIAELEEGFIGERKEFLWDKTAMQIIRSQAKDIELLRKGMEEIKTGVEYAVKVAEKTLIATSPDKPMEE